MYLTGYWIYLHCWIFESILTIMGQSFFLQYEATSLKIIKVLLNPKMPLSSTGSHFGLFEGFYIFEVK